MPAPKVNELRFIALLPYILDGARRKPCLYTMQAFNAGVDPEDGLWVYSARIRDRVTMKQAKGLMHNFVWGKHAYSDRHNKLKSISPVPDQGWFLGVWRGETDWHIMRILSRPDWDVDQTLELYATIGGCASV